MFNSSDLCLLVCFAVSGKWLDLLLAHLWFGDYVPFAKDFFVLYSVFYEILEKCIRKFKRIIKFILNINQSDSHLDVVIFFCEC